MKKFIFAFTLILISLNIYGAPKNLDQPVTINVTGVKHTQTDQGYTYLSIYKGNSSDEIKEETYYDVKPGNTIAFNWKIYSNYYNTPYVFSIQPGTFASKTTDSNGNAYTLNYKMNYVFNGYSLGSSLLYEAEDFSRNYYTSEDTHSDYNANKAVTITFNGSEYSLYGRLTSSSYEYNSQNDSNSTEFIYEVIARSSSESFPADLIGRQWSSTGYATINFTDSNDIPATYILPITFRIEAI